MVKEKLTGKSSATLYQVEMHEVESNGVNIEDATFRNKDEVKWEAKPNALLVRFIRTVGFEPACLYEIVVSYYAQFELTEENALKDIPEEQIRAEINADLPYFLLEQQGMLARVSHIIASLTSSFGGVPVILPPVLPPRQTN